MEIPRTRYAQSADGTYIAYQVFGDGPDLLLAWPWISHLEMLWEIDEPKSWLRALARFARVISRPLPRPQSAPDATAPTSRRHADMVLLVCKLRRRVT